MEKSLAALEAKGNQLRNQLHDVKKRGGYFPSQVDSELDAIREAILQNDADLESLNNDVRRLRQGIDENEERWSKLEIFKIPDRCDELRERIQRFNLRIKDVIKTEDFASAEEFKNKRNQLGLELEGLERQFIEWTGIEPMPTKPKQPRIDRQFLGVAA